jgi:hypothetical protein
MDVVVDLSGLQAVGSMASGDIWDLDGRHRKVRATLPDTPAVDTPQRRRATTTFAFPTFSDPPAAAASFVDQPPAPRTLLMQYTPAVNRGDTGTLPFGRPRQSPTPAMSFNPFQSGSIAAAPQYTTMYSPEKRTGNEVARHDSSADARRSLRGLLGLSTGGSAATDWTFTNVHQGSKSV